MTARRLWAPLLVTLLVAALIGPGMMAGAEPRATVTKSIMIPAAAFIPTAAGWYYQNEGGYLKAIGGSASFSAPLTFPVPEVNIRRIALYIYDNDGSTYRVCARLYRVSPPRADRVQMTPDWFCTHDSLSDPQVLTTFDISPRQVNTAFHGTYLTVTLDAGYEEIRFYGVKVNYSYETGA